MPPLNEAEKLLRNYTKNYQPAYAIGGYSAGMSNHRRFNLIEIEEMCKDNAVEMALKMRAAPLFAAKLQVDDGGPAQDFIVENLKRFWQKSLAIAMRSTPFGFAGSEAMYKVEDGQFKFDYLHPLMQRDTRPITRGGELRFVKVLSPNIGDRADGTTNDVMNQQPGSGDPIYLPAKTAPDTPTKAYWTVHSREKNKWYGEPGVQRAWCWWRLKTIPDGYVETFGKAMYKYAGGPMVLRAPDEPQQDTPGGPEQSPMDMMQSLAENAKAMAIMVLSSERDASGQFKYLIEKYGAEPLADFNSLILAGDCLDRNIHSAILIPPEILSHEGSTGGYSRSNISWLAFLLMCEQELNYQLEMFLEWCLRPCVLLTYGDIRFKVTPMPLLQDQANAGGQPGQPGQPGAMPPDQPPSPPGDDGGGDLMMSHGDDWIRYKGPHGGEGWRNSGTGDVLYQDDKPDGEGDSEAKNTERQSKRAQAIQALTAIGKKTLEGVKDKSVATALAMTAAAGKVEHAVIARVVQNIDKLPDIIKLPALGIVRISFLSYTLGQKAAKAVAQERGGERYAERIGRLCVICDLAGAKAIPMASAAMVGGAVAGALAFAPAGSLGYLAYSSARDPMAVLRAAKKGLAKLGSKKEALAMSMSTDQMPTLLERFASHDAGPRNEQRDDRMDLYEALVCAAMDDTRDLEAAIEAADEAMNAEGHLPVEMSHAEDQPRDHYGQFATMPIEQFAQHLQNIGHTVTTGVQSGEDPASRKILINHLHNAVAKRDPTMGLDTFKDRLVDGFQKGHIRLKRADLPQLYDPKDIKDSAIVHPMDRKDTYAMPSWHFFHNDKPAAEPTEMSVDVGGRKHKGKGPGGGQFTSEMARKTVDDIASAHIHKNAVGIAFDNLYAQAKQIHPEFNKEEFRVLMNKLHEEGDRFRLGGWPRMHDDLPDPELAVHVGGEKTRGPRDKVDRSKAPDLDVVGRLMWYLNPNSGDHSKYASKPVEMSQTEEEKTQDDVTFYHKIKAAIAKTTE